jgi:FkbM family methyltransferase
MDGYEPETVPLFFRLAQRSQVTIDIGAYVGFFTLLAAHANPEAQVYAFEPMPEVFDRLQKNISLNRMPHVQCLASAVSNAGGTAEFFHQSTGMPTSSSLSFDFMSSANGVISTTVPVTTLDSFVEEKMLSRVDLLKIDTESTEPDVLRGAINTIKRYQPMIFCEVLKGRGSEKPLEKILQPLGYRYYLLTSHGPELRDSIEGHPEWLNYLFTTLSPDEVESLYRNQ